MAATVAVLGTLIGTFGTPVLQRRAAHAAFELVGSSQPAGSRAELKRVERAFEVAVEAFIADARRLVI
ncbi:hypothetical protein [Kitasatospora sp. P5_F3]